jgi:hypothetical protein
MRLVRQACQACAVHTAQFETTSLCMYAHDKSLIIKIAGHKANLACSTTSLRAWATDCATLYFCTVTGWPKKSGAVTLPRRLPPLLLGKTLVAAALVAAPAQQCC